MRETASYPLISIITPTFNSEDTIEHTIQCILNQKNFNETYEHLIVDGLSTDDTLNILKKYPHLKIISEPDKGLYDAMNKGISMSKGKYIGILNSDDWYEPDTLARITRVIKNHPEVGVIHGDMLWWKDGDLYHKQRYKAHQKFYGMWIRHPTCFILKEVYDRYGAYNLTYRIQADYDIMLRYRKAKVKFYYIPAVLTNFRLGGKSHTKWTLKESLSVRVNNGWPFLWALISAVTVRSLYEGRLLLNNLFKK